MAAENSTALTSEDRINMYQRDAITNEVGYD